MDNLVPALSVTPCPTHGIHVDRIMVDVVTGIEWPLAALN